MIVFPCRVLRPFSTLLRRCSTARTRDAPPFVLLRQHRDGQSLAATRGDVSLRWHRVGSHEPAALAFTADHLDVLATGTADVALEACGSQHAAARWREGDAERTHRLPVVDADRVPAFPEPGGEVVPQPPSFLPALAEAARTAAGDDGRFALTRILLRGKTGQVVATDGKQLLVQGGFRFPWADDVLVPAVPAFAAKELVAAGDVAVGRNADHVLVVTGPWSFALRVAATARYPTIDRVVPRTEPAARCVFDATGVKDLIASVIALPGDDRDAAVTLDVADGVTIRSPGGSPKTVRVRATTDGTARVTFDRKYLVRALRISLTTLELHGSGKPVVARDGTRTYVWAALGEVDDPPIPVKQSDPEPKETTVKPTSAHPPNAEKSDAGRVPIDLLAEAESIRDTLQAAASRLSVLIGALRRHRKQSRALKQAVASLNSLKNLEP